MIIKLLDNQSDVNVGTFEAQLSVADIGRKGVIIDVDYGIGAGIYNCSIFVGSLTAEKMEFLESYVAYVKHSGLKDDIKNHLQKILQQDTKKKEILNIVELLEKPITYNEKIAVVYQIFRADGTVFKAIIYDDVTEITYENGLMIYTLSGKQTVESVMAFLDDQMKELS